MICPHCGRDIDHDCAREMGHRTKGKRTERKTASSRENMAKARAKRWPKASPAGAREDLESDPAS